MVLALFLLLFFQLLGEATEKYLGLFIPGPVVGMVYFFVALIIWPSLKTKVEGLSRFMNAHLALFFIPAGVGVIQYFDLFGRFGGIMIVTLLLSTTITLGVTAWVFHILLKRTVKDPSHD